MMLVCSLVLVPKCARGALGRLDVTCMPTLPSPRLSPGPLLYEQLIVTLLRGSEPNGRPCVLALVLSAWLRG
jgi:hypothetical protein